MGARRKPDLVALGILARDLKRAREGRNRVARRESTSTGGAARPDEDGARGIPIDSAAVAVEAIGDVVASGLSLARVFATGTHIPVAVAPPREAFRDLTDATCACPNRVLGRTWAVAASTALCISPQVGLAPAEWIVVARAKALLAREHTAAVFTRDRGGAVGATGEAATAAVVGIGEQVRVAHAGGDAGAHARGAIAGSALSSHALRLTACLWADVPAGAAVGDITVHGNLAPGGHQAIAVRETRKASRDLTRTVHTGGFRVGKNAGAIAVPTMLDVRPEVSFAPGGFAAITALEPRLAARNFANTGLTGDDRVVATTGGIAGAAMVQMGVEAQGGIQVAGVHEPIAVGVFTVAGLRGPRKDCAVGIIAILWAVACGPHPEPVAVLIQTARAEPAIRNALPDFAHFALHRDRHGQAARVVIAVLITGAGHEAMRSISQIDAEILCSPAARVVPGGAPGAVGHFVRQAEFLDLLLRAGDRPAAPSLDVFLTLSETSPRTDPPLGRVDTASGLALRRPLTRASPATGFAAHLGSSDVRIRIRVRIRTRIVLRIRSWWKVRLHRRDIGGGVGRVGCLKRRLTAQRFAHVPGRAIAVDFTWHTASCEVLGFARHK